MSWTILLIPAALWLCVAIYMLRFVYGYRLKNGNIQVTLFHVLPIYRIRIEDIETIRKASAWRELGLFDSTLRMGNRLFGDAVLIGKRKGVVRRVVITPPDANAFVSQVLALRSQGSTTTNPA
jgi:hypothetical protein